MTNAPERAHSHGEPPYQIIPPIAANDIPKDAVLQGPDAYWLTGSAPNLQVWRKGLIGPAEQIFNAEYPDEIFDREQDLMRAYVRIKQGKNDG